MLLSPPAGPAVPGKTAPWHGPAPLPVSQAVWQAFCSTARICALILAFRAVLGVLGAVLAFCAPQLAAQPIPAALAAGFLDLPNGIAALAAVPEPAAQFLLCSVFVNWAGLCIHLQTSDAVAPAALPQTGDGFPIEALAAAFCASVIGFGTAWKRR